MVIWVSKCDDFLTANDAPVDVSEEVVMGVLVGDLGMQLMIIGLACVLMPSRTSGIVEFRVDVFAEVWINVMVVSVIVLEDLAPGLYTIDVRIGVLIGSLADTVTGVTRGNGVDVLPGVNTNTRAATMTALEFILMLAWWEEILLFGREPPSCCTTTAWDCRVLQARMPSYQVWARFEFSALPHLPNQEPPRPQQLILPDFCMVPHSRHTELTGAAVTARADMWKMVKRAMRTMLWKLLSHISKHASAAIHFGLTFAGIQSFKPTVTYVSVASTATVLIPRTTRSTATDSPRFLEYTAVWTCHNRREDAWRGEWRGD